MTYKGQEIGIPTLELIQECINQWKLRVSAQEVYDYWTSRNWLTKKGQAVKTLESACNVANSLFVQRERKGGNISKNDISITNEELTCIMLKLHKEAPREWAKLMVKAFMLGYDISKDEI